MYRSVGLWRRLVLETEWSGKCVARLAQQNGHPLIKRTEIEIQGRVCDDLNVADDYRFELRGWRGI